MGVRVPPGVLLISVNVIQQFIRSIVESGSHENVLPWEIVEFLINMYADEGNPRLTHHTGSFAANAPAKRKRLAGGLHIEWNKIGALYVADAHAMAINSDAVGDLKKRVEGVIHEICHYNQHVRWDSGKISYRSRYIQGKKVPPMMDDNSDDFDPSALYDYSWIDMMEFWLRTYGYANSPHEVEAREFASAHLDEALGFIEEHFGIK